jgi:hypothetical protein
LFFCSCLKLLNEITAKAVPLDGLLGSSNDRSSALVADPQQIGFQPVATSVGDAVNRLVPSELSECLIARMLNTAAIIKNTITRMGYP